MKECQLCKTCFADDVTTCPKDGMATMRTINGAPVLEGKYHLESRLGQGGMGVVYKARHAYLKTQLAIKVILPDLVGNDPQLVTRFRQEALAAAAIRHQNVVSVTDYGVIDGSMPYLVMEYVEGEALHDVLAREKKLPQERAFELMSAICAGVGAAHHQGIVHRDLKPLNIMICNDKPNLAQAVKILDFGLAKIKSGELLGSFIQAQTTGLMGSPYYMSPEQWADDEPDSRSDIYSLGVMLYQVLAGEVPFKGSSIPAIMKKHITDPAPSLAAGGVTATPELERAMLHALQKDPEKRTPSTDVFIEELRAAIMPETMFINSAASRSLPLSSLKITTKPPRASVFVDNVSVGHTEENGSLLLEGIQSGNHYLRASHEGFRDWIGDVVCDGKPQEVVLELQEGVYDSRAAIPRPIAGDINPSSVTQRYEEQPDAMARTVQQSFDRRQFDVSVSTMLPEKKAGMSPLLLGIGAVFALLLIGITGLGAAYLLGMFGGGGTTGNNAPPTPGATPASSPVVVAGLVTIPSGTFRMGRDDGPEEERPENTMTVQTFKMDKYEITNAEYNTFVAETGHRPLPAHWLNSKPIPGQDRMPVRFVNIDDVNAFAEWRSKRDGVKYRLPTEGEWEYAARNGPKNNAYPWGDAFQAKCAVTDKENTEPEAVGTASCPDEWGVYDLVGNVFEWTGTKASLYPGSKGQMKEPKEPRNMIRGGSAFSKSTGDTAITTTFRKDIPVTTRDKELGFRLVTQN